jgi:hypothetical protein
MMPLNKLLINNILNIEPWAFFAHPDDLVRRNCAISPRTAWRCPHWTKVFPHEGMEPSFDITLAANPSAQTGLRRDAVGLMVGHGTQRQRMPSFSLVATGVRP